MAFGRYSRGQFLHVDEPGIRPIWCWNGKDLSQFKDKWEGPQVDTSTVTVDTTTFGRPTVRIYCLGNNVGYPPQFRNRYFTCMLPFDVEAPANCIILASCYVLNSERNTNKIGTAVWGRGTSTNHCYNFMRHRDTVDHKLYKWNGSQSRIAWGFPAVTYDGSHSDYRMSIKGSAICATMGGGTTIVKDSDLTSGDWGIMVCGDRWAAYSTAYFFNMALYEVM